MGHLAPEKFHGGLRKPAAGTVLRDFHPATAVRSRMSVPNFFSSEVEYVTVVMPALSPTMESGTIAEWSKQPGEEIAAGDVLCQVETDKATMAFEMQDDAVLAKQLVPAGDESINIGTAVAITVDDMAAYEAFLAADAAGEISIDGNDGPAAGVAVEEEKTTTETVSSEAAMIASTRTVADEFLLTPAARHMSESKGLDVRGLAGTGKGGRITKGDIIHAINEGVTLPLLASSSAPSVATVTSPAPSVSSTPAATSAPAPPAATMMDLPPAECTSGAGYSDSPASGMRKVIASRLTQSKAEVPHAYVSIEARLDPIMKLRKTLKAGDVNVSVNDLIIRCAGLALRDVPEANASWDAKTQSVVTNPNVDISVAVATPTGLMTPIVTGVDGKGLGEINGAVRDLATRARDGKLMPEEYQGGSFTISNLGMFGVSEFSAIINMPQACIMAVGGGERRLVQKEDEEGLSIETVMTARLSCDSRVVDSAVAAQFLQAFQGYMEQPKLTVL